MGASLWISRPNEEEVNGVNVKRGQRHCNGYGAKFRLTVNIQNYSDDWVTRPESQFSLSSKKATKNHQNIRKTHQNSQLPIIKKDINQSIILAPLNFDIWTIQRKSRNSIINYN